MKTRYRLIPSLRPLLPRLALVCLPALALAACSSSTDTAEADTQAAAPSGTIARKALLHNAPPPIKLLNAVGTVGEKVEKKFEKKSDTTTTTASTSDTTTPPQASQ
ncbi:hypothetical protein TSACC_22760 [Terrimicrobium sacchariphilum]|uniref:Uncharacterized protein n=1 Tax=Terrimicrobium sacchariphilum TaxID=690879 RepID=A0A146G9J6_TERSA|nr:hypothetical protein [Terrimicrobium sacchariphilum]GAT34335.1 hypothetical protein TSACC_22760 [Terrimicrobium sacchariphilum]